VLYKDPVYVQVLPLVIVINNDSAVELSTSKLIVVAVCVGANTAAVFIVESSDPVATIPSISSAVFVYPSSHNTLTTFALDAFFK